jgi:hypothetical protein
LVDLWDDSRLVPGDDWRVELSEAINTAKVAILLVSADFLASQFIVENELPPLLAAAKSSGVVILPVVVGASRFDRTPTLSCYQAVNEPSQPLSTLPVAEREKVWVRVANAVEAAMVGSAASEGWYVAQERKLRESLNELLNSEDGSFLIVSSGDYYVQFIVEEPNLYCEAVSNQFIPKRYQLSTAEAAAIVSLGFLAPTGEGQNFSRGYLLSDALRDVRSIAGSAIRVFRDAYHISSDVELEYRLTPQEQRGRA